MTDESTAVKRAPKYHILIAENDDKLAALLEKILMFRGYIIDIATNCRQTLQKLRPGTFDIVLLDHCLDNNMGFSLLESIKKRQPDADVITMTGNNSKEIEKHVRHHRVTYHLIKPYELQELLTIIDHIALRTAYK